MVGGPGGLGPPGGPPGCPLAVTKPCSGAPIGGGCWPGGGMPGGGPEGPPGGAYGCCACSTERHRAKSALPDAAGHGMASSGMGTHTIACTDRHAHASADRHAKALRKAAAQGGRSAPASCARPAHRSRAVGRCRHDRRGRSSGGNIRGLGSRGGRILGQLGASLLLATLLISPDQAVHSRRSRGRPRLLRWRCSRACVCCCWEQRCAAGRAGRGRAGRRRAGRPHLAARWEQRAARDARDAWWRHAGPAAQ